MNRRFTIRARTSTDDCAYDLPFEAEPWFRAATDQAIVKLMNCGWGGDYPADNVARWSAFSGPENPRLVNMFSHIEQDGVGFECHVDVEHAVEWLAENRPQILLQSPIGAVRVRAIPGLGRDDLEDLLFDDDRRIREAAISALGPVLRAARRDTAPPVIPAHVSTEDGRRHATFDALPWFQGATEEQVRELIKLEWGNDGPPTWLRAFAEGELPHTTSPHAELQRLFRWADEHDVYTNCRVNEEAALLWLAEHRPHIVLRQSVWSRARAVAVTHLDPAEVEAFLEDSDRRVREAAILTLGKTRGGPQGHSR